MAVLHYKTFGNPDDPPILLLHGFMGSIQDWLPVITRIINSYYCIAIDLPGHGLSLKWRTKARWDMSTTAAAIIAVMDAAGVRHCRLVGYSMGGRIAIYLALKYPERFSDVLAESASPGLESKAERLSRAEQDRLLAKRLESENFDAFLTAWYRQPLFATLQEHPAYPAMLSRRRLNTPAALAKSLLEAGSGVQPSLWNELKALKIPLLLVIGEKDTKFRAIAKRMQALSTAITHRTISGSSHNVHQEQPGLFADILNKVAIDNNDEDNTNRRKTI